MMRLNLQLKTILTTTVLGCFALSLSGCKTGGFKMPSMAFWKKENSLWAKSESVPPPATHFDPAPTIDGELDNELNSSNRESIAALDRKMRSGSNALDEGTHLESLANVNKSKPIRAPYQFENDGLAKSEEDNGFQPGGQIKKELPDFGSSDFSGGSSLAEKSISKPDNSFGGSSMSKGNPLAFTPKTGNQDNSFKRNTGSSGDNSFKGGGGFGGSSGLSNSQNSFQPGNSIAGKTTPNSNSFGSTPKSFGNQSQFAPNKPLGSNPVNPIASDSSFDPGTIRTPHRQEITQPKRPLAPMNSSPNSIAQTTPGNQGSAYPQTGFSGFGQSPKGQTGSLAPIEKKPFTNPNLGLANKPLNNPNQGFTPNKSLAPNQSLYPQSDVILPEALRTANIQFAPGSVGTLTPQTGNTEIR